jgi:hypothetical protein
MPTDGFPPRAQDHVPDMPDGIPTPHGQHRQLATPQVPRVHQPGMPNLYHAGRHPQQHHGMQRSPSVAAAPPFRRDGRHQNQPGLPSPLPRPPPSDIIHRTGVLRGTLPLPFLLFLACIVRRLQLHLQRGTLRTRTRLIIKRSTLLGSIPIWETFPM